MECGILMMPSALSCGDVSTSAFCQKTAVVIVVLLVATTASLTMTESATHSSSIADDSPHWHKAVAGAAAGAGSRLLTAPLDLLRIRRQLYPSSTPSNIPLSLYKIASTEGGFVSLFRGNVAATYLWVGYAAIQFTAYDYSSQFLSTNSNWSPATVAFLSGATAGVCATLATYPLDLCRTTFAAQGLKSSIGSSWTPPTSLRDFATTVYQRHGVGGFFAGSGPAVVQIIPYMGLNFLGYEFLTSRETSVTTSGMAGAVSGALSKIVVYPLDTVKKRMQMDLSSGKYQSMMDCLATIVRKEGPKSLYNGLVPSVLKNTLATGLSFAFFTFTKEALARLDTHSHTRQQRRLVAEQSQEI